MTRKEEIHKESYHKYTWSPAYMLAFEEGAEWADRTMLDKAIKFFQSKSKHGMIEENINEFINEFCKEMGE